MKIENLKHLRATIKLCREMGVDKIEVDGMKIELGAQPAGKNLKTEPQDEPKVEDQLSEQDYLFWSVDQQQSNITNG